MPWVYFTSMGFDMGWLNFGILRYFYISRVFVSGQDIDLNFLTLKFFDFELEIELKLNLKLKFYFGTFFLFISNYFRCSGHVF